MECIHLIHPSKYNGNEDRWFRTAFRNNAGSLSIIGCECMAVGGTTACEHIRKYDYKQFTAVVGEPPIFWKFDTDILPAGGRLRQQGRRDPCHYIVEGLDDGQLWPVFENVPLSDVSICADRNYRPLTRDDLPASNKTEQTA